MKMDTNRFGASAQCVADALSAVILSSVARIATEFRVSQVGASNVVAMITGSLIVEVRKAAIAIDQHERQRRKWFKEQSKKIIDKKRKKGKSHDRTRSRG